MPDDRRRAGRACLAERWFGPAGLGWWSAVPRVPPVDVLAAEAADELRRFYGEERRLADAVAVARSSG